MKELSAEMKADMAAKNMPLESPILVRSDQVLPSLLTGRLEQLIGHPVDPLPRPPRRPCVQSGGAPSKVVDANEGVTRESKVPTQKEVRGLP